VPSASSLPDRLQRAARLEPALYEEVAHDATATGAALAIALAAVALEALGGGGGPARVLHHLAEGAARFGLWVGAIHLGARALGLSDALAPLFRALGFATLPFALGLFGDLPIFGGLVDVAKWVLGVAAATIAARVALRCELSTALGLVAAALGVALLGVQLLP
jgi:hypothetical protein